MAWLALGDSDPWAGWAPCAELAEPSYAERVHADSLLRTRANTWSNLAYVLVGLYALALAAHDRRAPRAGHVRRTPALSALFGAACVWLGLGSGLFHASLTLLGQQLDVAAMYPPLLALLAMSAGRAAPATATWPRLAAVWLVASALLFVFKWEMNSAVVLPTLILACVGARSLERLRGGGGELRWAALMVVSLGLAVLCRQLDVAGRFSGPDDWWQGHSAWHLLCAVSLGAAYLDQRVAIETGRAG